MEPGFLTYQGIFSFIKKKMAAIDGCLIQRYTIWSIGNHETMCSSFALPKKWVTLHHFYKLVNSVIHLDFHSVQKGNLSDFR